MRRLMTTLGGATALFAACSSSALAVDATLPDPNYPGGRALTYMIKVVAEQRLGLEIGIERTNAVPVFWKAMDRGKGEIDVWPEVWMPNQKALVDEYVNEKGTVKLGSKPYMASQGLCVTRETREEHGVGSIYDLISADNAKLFDTDGDGKGELYIGPSGWISTNVEKVRARDYGYGEVFELQVMEEPAALANLDAAVTKGNPFVFACYGPHHIFKLHDLVMLEEPAHDPEKFQVRRTQRGDGLVRAVLRGVGVGRDPGVRLLQHVARTARPDARGIPRQRALRRGRSERLDLRDRHQWPRAPGSRGGVGREQPRRRRHVGAVVSRPASESA